MGLKFQSFKNFTLPNRDRILDGTCLRDRILSEEKNHARRTKRNFGI